ncbi:hypothetical protein KJ766_00675 [Patescibacteria group bacterium]|nr:hypothetical protein [Patescibacteria group bacterium]
MKKSIKKYVTTPVATVAIGAMGIAGFQAFANAQGLESGEANRFGLGSIEQRAHARVPQEAHEAIISTLEENDYQAFLQVFSDNGLETPVGMNEERFSEMVERHADGQNGSQFSGDGSQKENRGRFMMGMFGENQDALEEILASGDFDAFQSFINENAGNKANRANDAEKLREHFDRMVERYQSGECRFSN